MAVDVAAFLHSLATSSHRDAFVLRGSVLLQQWLAERTFGDLDLLALSSLEIARGQIEEITTVDCVEPIWADTRWPGLRFRIGALQLDLGYDDPMVRPPREMTVHGARVLAVQPETLFAWKVHGLFEHGPGRWRPKDLWDVHEMAHRIVLDGAIVGEAVALAFKSRDTPLRVTHRFFDDAWGRSASSRRKWLRFRRNHQVPEDLATVKRAVAAAIAPFIPQGDATLETRPSR